MTTCPNGNIACISTDQSTNGEHECTVDKLTVTPSMTNQTTDWQEEFDDLYGSFHFGEPITKPQRDKLVGYIRSLLAKDRQRFAEELVEEINRRKVYHDAPYNTFIQELVDLIRKKAGITEKE